MSLSHGRGVRLSSLRCILVNSLLWLSCLPSFAQKARVLAPHDPVPKPLSTPVPIGLPAVPRSLIGGLWMTDGNWKSSILLKNNLETSALEVSPILYVSNGTKIALKPVTLEKAGVAVVNINQSLAESGIAPYAQLTGYVEVQYTLTCPPFLVQS